MTETFYKLSCLIVKIEGTSSLPRAAEIHATPLYNAPGRNAKSALLALFSCPRHFAPHTFLLE